MQDQRAAFQQSKPFNQSQVSRTTVSNQAFLEPQRLLSAVDEILAEELGRWRKQLSSFDPSTM